MVPCVFPSPCSSPFQECFNSSQTAPLYNSYYHKCIKIACTLIFLFKTFRLKAFLETSVISYLATFFPVFSNKQKFPSEFTFHFLCLSRFIRTQSGVKYLIFFNVQKQSLEPLSHDDLQTGTIRVKRRFYPNQKCFQPNFEYQD